MYQIRQSHPTRQQLMYCGRRIWYSIQSSSGEGATSGSRNRSTQSPPDQFSQRVADSAEQQIRSSERIAGIISPYETRTFRERCRHKMLKMIFSMRGFVRHNKFVIYVLVSMSLPFAYHQFINRVRYGSQYPITNFEWQAKKAKGQLDPKLIERATSGDAVIERRHKEGYCLMSGQKRDDSSIVCGYLNKVDSLGLIKTAKKRWYILGSNSHYLYGYKSARDTLPVAVIDINKAVFTCDAINQKGFQIRTGNDQLHHFETLDPKERIKWLDALQRCRAIYSGSSSAGDSSTEHQSDQQKLTEEPLFPHLSEFLPHKADDKKPTRLNLTGIDVASDACQVSTFYLTPTGELHDQSLTNVMEESKPAAVVGEPVTHRRRNSPTRSSFSGVDAAVNRMSAMLTKLTTSKKSCDACADLIGVIQTLKERCINLNDDLLANRELVQTLQRNIVALQNQTEVLKQYKKIKNGDAATGTTDQLVSIDGDSSEQEAIQFLLETENSRTKLSIENEFLKRELAEAKTKITSVEEDADRNATELEMMKTALKAKDEMIASLADSSCGATEAENAIEDVPDYLIAGVGDATVCPETVVTDADFAAAINEQETEKLKDLVHGYQTQNQFLNKEILELHQVVKNLEDRNDHMARRNFDSEAQFYQLKSRYLLLLNHFQPNKELAPNVVTELLEDAKAASFTSSGNHRLSFTDDLGFYLTSADKERMQQQQDPVDVNASQNLIETAGEYQRFCNELATKQRQETSGEYLSWLTRWDSVLVNYVGKPIGCNSPELKELIRSGIPHTYRAKVWKSMIQWWVKEEMSEVGAGYFECLCRKSFSVVSADKEGFDPCLKQIDLDLTRTLPHNKYFEDMQAQKIESLRRVLYAFRWHNKEIGYCQGLNRLAAVALLYMSEEDAFWCLAAIVDHLQPRDYYGTTMLAAQADQRVLKDLVQEKFPKLAVHLRSSDVDLSLFTFNWFLTIFVDSFPHKTYLNIWDCLLSEGNKVLFRFALAALKISENEILSCRSSGALHSCLNKMGERMTDYQKLSQVAFRDLNPFPSKHIESKRQQHLQHLQSEFQARSSK